MIRSFLMFYFIFNIINIYKTQTAFRKIFLSFLEKILTRTILIIYVIYIFLIKRY